jgi:hypothetical protein
LRHHAPPSACDRSHTQRTCAAQQAPPTNQHCSSGTFRFNPKDLIIAGAALIRAQTRVAFVVSSPSHHRTSAQASATGNLRVVVQTMLPPANAIIGGAG